MQSQVYTTVYLGHGKFFRGRLLISSPEEINQLIETMDKECQQIKQEAIKFSWYMRGGLTYDQAMALSFGDREVIGNLIKENLETTKKSGLPFF
jgi:hypothetical protein